MESDFSEELQAQAHEIVTTSGSSSMETLFSNLFSSQQPIRSKSYHILNCCKKHYPSYLFFKLFYLLRGNFSAETRTNTVTVLRYIKVGDLWPALSETARVNLKKEFLACLKGEEQRSNLITLCNIVSDMACVIYKVEDQWQELIDFLVQSLELGSENVCEAALLVIVSLPKDCKLFFDHSLISCLESLHKGLLNALKSIAIDVQVAASGAVRSLMKLFSRNSRHDLFLDLLCATTNAIFNLLEDSQEYHAQRIITELLVLVTQETQILKSYLDTLVLKMALIVDHQILKDNITFCAIKFLTTIAERKDLLPIMREVSDQTVMILLTISMRLLFCIEDDLAWYQIASEEGENAGKTEVYKYGMECLNRFSSTFGEKRIVPIAFQLLPMVMDSQEWQKRHAGITMLGVIAKECSDEMVMSGNYMEQAITKIVNSFRDPHPRVCWAAFNFIQLPVDFVQAAQILCHTRIFPALVDSLDGNHNAKVKEQVASAALQFVNNMSPSLSTMHIDVDDMLTKLLSFLQNSDQTVKARRHGFCLFNIVTQQCIAYVPRKHFANYSSILLDAFTHRNSKIKQEAVRGIGICAEFGGLEFKPFASTAVHKLNNVIKKPNRSRKEDLNLYRTGVSTLGKMFEFHRDCIDISKVVSTWLNHLPLKDSSTEAKSVHRQLCSLVERRDSEIVGHNDRYLPKIVAIFVEVINLGTDFTEEETIRRMTLVLKDIGQNRRVYKSVAAKLNEQQQASFKSIISS